MAEVVQVIVLTVLVVVLLVVRRGSTRAARDAGEALGTRLRHGRAPSPPGSWVYVVLALVLLALATWSGLEAAGVVGDDDRRVRSGVLAAFAVVVSAVCVRAAVRVSRGLPPEPG